MTDDLKTSFLTYYIRSLGERSRAEKKGTKYGFDWVIYSLGLADDWTPYRLPFLRGGGDEMSRTKPEAEFGIDLAFLSSDRKTLRIFALKDEVLNNANWGRHDFDVDLRKAAAPDLSAPELSDVEDVCVILAYNKDEDRNGVELFDRLVAGLGTKVGDAVALTFDRWNLTTIVEKARDCLLTPSLLPQKFFSHFSYICSQFADFRHGSDEWAMQLVPNWRHFLDELFAENADERCVRLLPVALMILREYGDGNETHETGWIDLAEWGMLAAWKVFQETERDSVKQAVVEIWTDFYLVELNRYYAAHAEHLGTRYSLEKCVSGGFVDTIATAVIAQWHLGRLGLLALGLYECLTDESETGTPNQQQALVRVSDWTAALLQANPAAMRPLIDLHHIELVLTWFMFWQSGRDRDLYHWLLMLSNRLAVRRIGQAQIPFIEGSNSIELVFETVASAEKPEEFCEHTSTFILCLLELICSLPDKERDELLLANVRRLALGRADCGNPIDGCEPLNLMSWVPPADWQDRVLSTSLGGEGESVSVHLSGSDGQHPQTGNEVAALLQTLTDETRAKRSCELPENLPLSVVILSCLKHRSPLPPEIWRQGIFESADDVTDSPTADTPEQNSSTPGSESIEDTGE